ncbi:hypothetical protein [Micromonospora sp. KC213]|uniref:hypothetical protein n=1 Tax=Micromonospora sp. KC213 TaxID=2530378 RepID=UPI001053D5D3|nr:hypothetical protein [Micromonospora sp. KC213]TDC43175.1 hypothetical protein E1166_04895 [Micromonospora sp. KC213]
MKFQAGELFYVTRRASPQFVKPIYFRLIRVLDLSTYQGWIWLDGYELNAAGDATERREIYVQKEGLKRLRVIPRQYRHQKEPSA